VKPKKKPGPRIPRLPKGIWLKEYPFKPNFLELPRGGYLHYLDEGAGLPVLMVHGNPTSSFMYRSLIRELSSDFRCLVPDHLGMGLSSRPRAKHYGFKLSDRIADLGFLMDSVDLNEPVHLIVHDWGGPIGLGWAGANPNRVASVTLMNTGLRLPTKFSLPGRLGFFRQTGFLGQFLSNRLNLFLWGLIRHGTVRPLSKTAVSGLTAPYRIPLHRQAIGRFVADIPLSPSHSSWGTLQNVDRSFAALSQVPVFFVWGLQDFVFTPAFLADFQARRPEAPVLALPWAGHLLLEDEPEKIGRAIRQFLGQSR
jgi:haloalkane dehalogenase